ncbi:DNA-damage-inducible protein D [Mucilaginibacter mallensis]|uniref:DNA-damage-inducible protein D n=1 Tax=Mucilaginibacter mallensis TaxID=652787 RepID=A0A1H2C2Y1_MUCMA|nr:DNA damage-inducible protein D [Mucilaginibacter mallensis]SDT64888.1 DNA-damage-inducible protein D [Mucilaginibacter mallensis]
MEEKSVFEGIKHLNSIGQEYWSGRELYKVLNYIKWEKFLNVIDKAKEACKNSAQEVDDHFPRVEKMVELGSGAKRDIGDLHLSRYACYLIIQNADPSKEVVALGQTYFAIQTRKQEIMEQSFEQLRSEEEKRLYLRKEMAEHNKHLADAAKDAGVIQPWEYAVFQNHGYMGLYNGLGAKEIHAKKSLKKNQNILDHMGSTELAANLFRATQTEEKLKREKIKGKANANKAHYEVGKKVRQTIKELGGTMPEELPAENSIKKLDTGN